MVAQPLTLVEGINSPPRGTVSRHVPCFKAGDRVAVGVKQIELLSSDLPPAHVPQRLQESLLGLHAFQTGHHRPGHLAQDELVAMQFITACQ